MDNRLLKRFVSLDKRRRKLDVELKDTKKKLEELEPTVRENLVKSGTDRIAIDGLLLYIKRTIWVKALEGAEGKQATIAALKAVLPQYISDNYNSNSVTAWLREVEQALPNGVKFASCATLAELEAQGVDVKAALEAQGITEPEAIDTIKTALGVSEVFSVETRLS